MKSSKTIQTSPSTPATSSKLLLDNQLCFAMYSTSLTMSKVYAPFLKGLGVTYPQYVVLMALWEKDAVTVSELGEKVFLDSGTLTPLLKRLESLELIQRRRSSEDERRVLVTLTPKGRNLQEQANEVADNIACAVQCSPREVKLLTQRLQEMRAILSKSVSKN